MNNVFAVFDTCSGVFGDPVVVENEASARRIFRYSLSGKGVPDYVRRDSVLYSLGYFDHHTGSFSFEDVPYIIDRGCNVVVPDCCVSEVSTVEE